MILSYVDVLGDGKRHRIGATITKEHDLSSYGQPVVLLDGGGSLDASSWILMAYRVVRANKAEQALIEQWRASFPPL